MTESPKVSTCEDCGHTYTNSDAIEYINKVGICPACDDEVEDDRP